MSENIQAGDLSSSSLEARRKHIEIADAENRIDGVFRDPCADKIFNAYVTGEIAATDIVPMLKTLLEKK